MPDYLTPERLAALRNHVAVCAHGDFDALAADWHRLRSHLEAALAACDRWGQQLLDKVGDVERLAMSSDDPRCWVNVQDRLPENGETVLAYHLEYDWLLEGMEVADYVDGGFQWSGDRLYPLSKVTHWMPLPPKPENSHAA